MSLKNSVSALLVFFILILVFTSVFAQDEAESAKLKQKHFGILIAQILADAPNLKLGENRAIVYARAGNLVWQNDKKLARVLFQNAVGELLGAQMLIEAKPKSNYDQNELRTGQQTRPQILQMIAARDAALALDLLDKTRPVEVSRAIFSQSAKSGKINESSSNYSYLAQNEFNLEQGFARLAAEQNPERAVKMLKESLKKGFSGETVNLLNKLFEKDAETAAEIASEIVSKLIQSRFIKEDQPLYQNVEIAVWMLNDFNRQRQSPEKASKFNEAEMRNLTDSLVAFYLDKAVQYNYLDTHSIIAIAEKLAPTKVAQLKNLRNNNGRRTVYGEHESKLQNILNGEATADQMISEAAKFPVNLRGQIYQAAANKFAEAGNFAGASELINDNFEDSALEEALRNLNQFAVNHLINKEKYAEAENLIDNFPDDSRTGSLIWLANTIYGNNPAENKSKAVAILEKARASVPGNPENSREMSILMQVIQAFAIIEPTEAFRSYEPLIPQMNELSDASAVLGSFQGGGNVRQNEFLLIQGDSFGFYGADFSVFQTLAKNDFDRTMNLINSFTRNEIRLSLKIQLAGSVLN